MYTMIYQAKHDYSATYNYGFITGVFSNPVSSFKESQRLGLLLGYTFIANI